MLLICSDLFNRLLFVANWYGHWLSWFWILPKRNGTTHVILMFLASLPNIQWNDSKHILFLTHLFCSYHFSFFVFGHCWRWSYKNTKILCNLCLHFARQDGQDGKNGKKITQLKWPKTEMGWTKHKNTRLLQLC